MKKYIMIDQSKTTVDLCASEMRMQILKELFRLESALVQEFALLQSELNALDSAFVETELERRKQFMAELQQKEQRYY